MRGLCQLKLVLMMLQSRPLFDLRIEVAPPFIIPGGPHGERRHIPILGGDFSGERLSGNLLPGGADFQLLRADRAAELDVRMSLQTNDGAIIHLKGTGLRHGPAAVLERLAKGETVDRSEYYFRQTMFFEAPSGAYDWLNRIIGIGMGERRNDHVLIEAFEIV
jgi:hypothetical protein